MPKLEKYVEYLQTSDILSNPDVNELTRLERLDNSEFSLRNSGIYSLAYSMMQKENKFSELNIELVLEGYYSDKFYEIKYIDVHEYEISKPEKYQQVSMLELIKRGGLYEHRMVFSNGEKFYVRCGDVKFNSDQKQETKKVTKKGEIFMCATNTKRKFCGTVWDGR